MNIRRTIERISPLSLGTWVSTSLLVIFLLAETVLGRWDALMAAGELDVLAQVSSGVLRDMRIAIVHCLVIGYLPAAFLYVLRSGDRTVRSLLGALDCTREEQRTLEAPVRLSGRVLIITGLAGFALSLLSPYLVPPVPMNLWNPSTWGPEVVWHRILGPATSIGLFWFVYAIVAVSIRLSRIAMKLGPLNLLDLSPLAPITRQGHTHALLSFGLLSVWSLVMIETGFGQMMLLIVAATVVGSALAVWIPMRGANKKISQSKDAELDWVNDAISEQRRAMRNPNAGRKGGEMADLVAYRGVIESVSEWPITISTYVRLFVYALFPVASWGIGVVAEEIVGKALSL